MNTLFPMPVSTKCSITAENGALVFTSPYDAALIASIKGLIPASDRQWDSKRRAWIVAATYGTTLQKLALQYCGDQLEVPVVTQYQGEPSMRLLEVHYIGATKDRGSGDRSAYALLNNGSWGAAFPESVLRSWFEGLTQVPSGSLYSVLGISPDADDDNLKKAYRRMVLQWHPDRCHEPDAHEVFLRIQHAYTILSTPKQRARYDAGLALQGTMNQDTPQIDTYRSPLRCGYILANGVDKIGRFWVETILAWEDITRNGQTLVSSWVTGAKEPLIEWV